MGRQDTIDKILPNGKGVWIPIDHGVTDFPCEGLENIEQTIRDLIAGGVDVIVAHKGVVDRYSHLCNEVNTSMIAHLSASTRHGGKNSSNKVLVGDVDEALLRGAVGVSCQVNIGSKNEHKMFERMGHITREAYLKDVPVLGMVYVRGENVKIMDGDSTNGYAHAARIAFELGCDVAKTVWPGNAESFAEICQAAPIPLLVAGGPSSGNSREILTMVKQSLESGGSGVCMGRQIFAHPQVTSIAKALVMIVHQGLTVDQAIEKCSL
jgi:DhnA family fructose-bisphosphate aldolase class Ia